MPKLINESLLRQLILNNNIRPAIYDELVSTNTTAKKMAADGENEGLLIIAEHQTGGKGRLGRSFYSPRGTGLYFSLVLRPKLPPEESILITSAAAVAVSEAIESIAKLPTNIKWVNDIFISGKKVCGILSESAFNSNGSGMDYEVLGIGINLLEPASGFPKDIENVAGALTNTPPNDFATSLLAEVINRFDHYYRNLRSIEFLKSYRDRLMLKNKTVTFNKGDTPLSGTVLDVDESFRLKVKLINGEITFLSSGEVSLGSGQIAGG